MSKIGLTGTCLCLFLLSGCSWLGDWPDDKADKQSSVRVVQPDNKEFAAMERKALEMPPKQANGQPLMLPPLSGDGQQQAMVSQEAAPMASLAATEKGPDTDFEKRIERLEASVLQIHEALEKMQPALQRLAGLEGSLESLIGQVEPAAGGDVPAGYTEVPAGYTEYNGYDDRGNDPQSIVPYPPPNNAKSITREDMMEPLAPLAPLAATEKPSSSAPVASTPAPASSYSGFVDNVRVGEHPDKTRLVLDVSSALNFDVHQEAGGQVLVVELPSAGWRTLPFLQPSGSPLIESYTSESDGRGGTRFTVKLKKDAKVLWAERLKPSGLQGYRIVIDLAAA